MFHRPTVVDAPTKAIRTVPGGLSKGISGPRQPYRFVTRPPGSVRLGGYRNTGWSLGSGGSKTSSGGGYLRNGLLGLHPFSSTKRLFHRYSRSNGGIPTRGASCTRAANTGSTGPRFGNAGGDSLNHAGSTSGGGAGSAGSSRRRADDAAKSGSGGRRSANKGNPASKRAASSHSANAIRIAPVESARILHMLAARVPTGRVSTPQRLLRARRRTVCRPIASARTVSPETAAPIRTDIGV